MMGARANHARHMGKLEMTPRTAFPAGPTGFGLWVAHTDGEIAALIRAAGTPKLVAAEPKPQIDPACPGRVLTEPRARRRFFHPTVVLV